MGIIFFEITVKKQHTGVFHFFAHVYVTKKVDSLKLELNALI